MSSNVLLNRILSAGLTSARNEWCREQLVFAQRRIQLDVMYAGDPYAQWRKGSFSWVFVREVEYWSNWFFREVGLIHMAKKASRNNKSRSLENYSFVRCELTAEDKKAAKIWIEENMHDMGPMVHDVVASDYKLSCSFSPDHDTFTVSLTGKEGSVNEFKTLTARHREWTVAAMTVLYKHAVVFKSGVWETDEPEDDGWA